MLDDRLEPVASRVTMGDGVYLQLRNALITGRFDRLAAENALEVASNGSAKVPQVSVERLDDIYRARAVLEGMATELAAAHVDQGGLAALEAIVADHEATYASGNVYDMLLKNRDFHFAIYRASGSEVLVQLIDTLWLRHGPYMRMLSSEISPRPGSGLQEPLSQHHRVIVEALRKRDGAAARDAMVADIGATQGLLRQLCMAVESSR